MVNHKNLKVTFKLEFDKVIGKIGVSEVQLIICFKNWSFFILKNLEFKKLKLTRKFSGRSNNVWFDYLCSRVTLDSLSIHRHGTHSNTFTKFSSIKNKICIDFIFLIFFFREVFQVYKKTKFTKVYS